MVYAGATRTDWENFAGGGREQIEATIPLGRVASAEDIAGSDQSHTGRYLKDVLARAPAGTSRGPSRGKKKRA